MWLWPGTMYEVSAPVLAFAVYSTCRRLVTRLTGDRVGDQCTPGAINGHSFNILDIDVYSPWKERNPRARAEITLPRAPTGVEQAR